MINEIKNKIHALVQKYEQGKEVYRTLRFNETQVRNESLDSLFEILGNDTHIKAIIREYKYTDYEDAAEELLEYLGDVVQSYINKILFLRVYEDRNIETYQSLLQIANHHSHQELIAKFKVADSRYNFGLFEEKLSDEIIGNVT